MQASSSGSTAASGSALPWASTSLQGIAPSGSVSIRVTTIGMPDAVSGRSVRRARRSPSQKITLGLESLIA